MTLVDQTLGLLKQSLGITDASKDAQLTQAIQSAIDYVEGRTKRYFDEPKSRTDYRNWNGDWQMVLDGHIDDSLDANINPSEQFDPTTSLVISQRPLGVGAPADWTALVEGTDYERHDDYIQFLMPPVWPSPLQLRFVYLDGYASAPEDIKDVIVEVATDRFIQRELSASRTAGVTGEKLGDFSYSKNLTVAGTGAGVMSDRSKQTINRYRRQLV